MPSTPPRTKSPAPTSKLPPTTGGRVCRWIEGTLVHGEGDWWGKPFRLRRWQKAFIYRLYEQNPDGSRKYRRALWGFPKGNGKSEVAAAIALYELAGGNVSPEVVVAAASYDQADIVFAAAKAQATHENSPLLPFLLPYQKEIQLKDLPGHLMRVPAEAGPLDGLKPSCFIADELHEWEGRRERVHLVVANGLAKRSSSFNLNITTAGWNPDSLCGKLYEHGKRVQSGEEDDPSFLFEWWEAPPDVDLTTEAGRRAAVMAANPAAGDFLDVESVLRRFHEIPEYEWRRYHLNQWTSSPERWLPLGTWEAAERSEGIPPNDTEITLGFDGSYAHDATALVGCTLDGYLFPVNLWEKPAQAIEDWRVPILEVENAIRIACGRWSVLAVASDPFRWQDSLARLEADGIPIEEWHWNPMNIIPAASQFYDGVMNGRVTHNGDADLSRHIGNVQLKVGTRGPQITKDHKGSSRRIDLAAAALMAYDSAVKLAGEESVYVTRGLLAMGTG